MTASASDGGARRLRPIHWIPLWVLAPLLAFLGFYRPFVESAGRAEAMPPGIGAWAWYGSLPDPDRPGELRRDPRFLTPDHLRQLGTDDAVYRTYVRDGDPEPLILTAVFHSSNWKSVHPPQLCLEGSAMTILQEGVVPLGDGVTAGRILTVTDTQNGDYPPGSRYVSYYVYGAPDMITAGYSDFFWHHLPRALFRQDTEGFLLRAETFVVGDDVAGADARCRGFLEALLPLAKEQLR